MLSQENKRLETRIQQLNSDLFKERSSNAELSQQVKSLLAELEEIKRRSINPVSEQEDDESGGTDDQQGGSAPASEGVKESAEDVLAKIEKVEIKDSLAALSTDAELRAPSPRSVGVVSLFLFQFSITPFSSYFSQSSDEVWSAKYAQVCWKLLLSDFRRVHHGWQYFDD